MQTRFLESLNPVYGNSITGFRRYQRAAVKIFYRFPVIPGAGFRRYREKIVGYMVHSSKLK